VNEYHARDFFIPETALFAKVIVPRTTTLSFVDIGLRAFSNEGAILIQEKESLFFQKILLPIYVINTL